MTQSHSYTNKNDSTILFLFSGTGNSLNAALRIQENIENCEILSIPRVFEEKKFDYESAKIGFIFPIYFLDAPQIVREFLKKIRIKGNPYIFAVATSGGEFGKSFRNINKILAKQNRKLHSEFSLVVPGNSIILTDKTSTPEEIEQIIKKSEVRIDEIIEIIKKNEIERFIPWKTPFYSRVYS